MARFRKKPFDVKIDLMTEERKIDTLKGSQNVRAGQYLATGIIGERWAFDEDVFQTYTPVQGRPGYYRKNGGDIVEAVQFAYPIEINRPGWKHAGSAGSWFVTRSPNDPYVVRADIFDETYEPVDN